MPSCREPATLYVPSVQTIDKKMPQIPSQVVCRWLKPVCLSKCSTNYDSNEVTSVLVVIAATCLGQLKGSSK